MLHRCFLYRICTGFYGKIGKNLSIFCIFFSLCINDLQESCKKICSKYLTKFENVVSLQRCLIVNKTTKQQIK